MSRQDLVSKEIIATEYKMIVKALSDHLGRKPRLNNLQLVTKSYTQGNPLDYDLKYNGDRLGRIKFRIIDDNVVVQYKS